MVYPGFFESDVRVETGLENMRYGSITNRGIRARGAAAVPPTHPKIGRHLLTFPEHVFSTKN